MIIALIILLTALIILLTLLALVFLIAVVEQIFVFLQIAGIIRDRGRPVKFFECWILSDGPAPKNPPKPARRKRPIRRSAVAL